MDLGYSAFNNIAYVPLDRKVRGIHKIPWAGLIDIVKLPPYLIR